MVLQWLGYALVSPALILDHLHKFSHLRGTSNHHRPVMYLIWLSCVQVIWNERNKEHFLHQLFNKIKLHTF